MKFHEHPLNAEIGNYLAWLLDQVEKGRLTASENYKIVQAGNNVFRASGLPQGPDADPVAIAVFRQQFHVFKSKTIELCPHLADEVRNMSSGQSR